MRPRPLALFGGAPLFELPRTIGQLYSPPLPEVFALFEQSGRDRDQLVHQLELKLARQHNVLQCVVVANAGLGLTLLMHTVGGRSAGEVIMPAFTFRGLPHFARWAGHDVRFCDVDEDTHALDPLSVDEACNDRTRAILGVCNFNDPGSIRELEAISARRGIPLIFDSVYAIGATYDGRLLGGNGVAEVYSLHATKLLNGFEGGYITTNDAQLAKVLRSKRDACSVQTRSVESPAELLSFACGINAYHAATALASVEHLEEIVARNGVRYKAYQAMCARIPGMRLVPYANDSAGFANYELAIVELSPPWPITRDETVRLLRAEGLLITAYYSPPLHRPPHAHLDPLPYLPVTDALANRFLQLPVGELVEVEDVQRIEDLMMFIGSHAEEIAAQLRASLVS